MSFQTFYFLCSHLFFTIDKARTQTHYYSVSAVSHHNISSSSASIQADTSTSQTSARTLLLISQMIYSFPCAAAAVIFLNYSQDWKNRLVNAIFTNRFIIRLTKANASSHIWRNKTSTYETKLFISIVITTSKRNLCIITCQPYSLIWRNFKRTIQEQISIIIWWNEKKSMRNNLLSVTAFCTIVSKLDNNLINRQKQPKWQQTFGCFLFLPFKIHASPLHIWYSLTWLLLLF